MNPDFDAGIQALGADGRKLVLLCRSGVRSVAAAQRGKLGGWRFHGLPWRQS